MKILVVGATGNLGRQIVRKAIDEGHTVRCMVRNREKAQYLEQWGAQLFAGDLRDPESFPPMLIDMEVVILAASALANRNTKDKTNSITNVDDVGTRLFIDAIKAVGNLHVIYASMLNSDKFPKDKMMGIKCGIENHLKASGLPYTILRLSGFLQGVISEFALPILEKKPIRVARKPSPIAYISTLDAARYFVTAATRPEALNRTIGVSGPLAWSPQEVISLCDELAKVNQVPKVSILTEGQKKFNELLAKMLDPNLIDLLRFSEVFATGIPYEANMEETEALLGIPTDSLEGLEPFMKEYFVVMKRSLRKKNYQEPKVRSPF
jgi:uncharacterized protein YbjT (DUF2867 family)